MFSCCRGRDRCRHFVINQSKSGQFLVHGDNRVHDTVSDLIEHYKTSPIQPFGEHLTTSCFEVRKKFFSHFLASKERSSNCRFALAGTEWRAVWYHPGWLRRKASWCCEEHAKTPELRFGAAALTAAEELQNTKCKWCNKYREVMHKCYIKGPILDKIQNSEMRKVHPFFLLLAPIFR